MEIKTDSYRKSKKKKEFKYKQDRDMLQRYLEDMVYYAGWIRWLLIIAALILFGIFLEKVVTGLMG